jgi:acetyl esterase/lipase
VPRAAALLIAFLGLGCGVEPRQRPVRFLSEESGEAEARPTKAAELIRRVYTYKTVGSLELKADVFRLSHFKKGPILVFIHGGQLVGGDRGIVPQELQPFARAGYSIVTIDHRLAPETKLAGIVEDVQDAVRWAHGDGARVFSGDPDRLAILGVGSGGYLAMLAAETVDPPPRAVVSIGGISDILADAFTHPDENALSRTHLTEEEAMRDVGQQEITRRQSAARLYLWSRQTGRWPALVSGLDPETQADAFGPFRPIRHVTNRFPSAFLVHGQEDKDVPVQQSASMAQELGRKEVPFELVVVPGAGTGLAGAPEQEAGRIYQRIHDFLDRHLAPAGS